MLKMSGCYHSIHREKRPPGNAIECREKDIHIVSTTFDSRNGSVIPLDTRQE